MTEKTFREQSAAFAYRRSEQGLEIVLVTSMGARRWVLPKGDIDEGFTARASAAREAFEEAGVEGDMGEDAIGSYHYAKSALKGGVVCRVAVFPMEVRRVRSDWPEKELRRREWMTIDAAAAAVNERELKDLITRFGRELDRSDHAGD